jgi:hypothetical protein
VRLSWRLWGATVGTTLSGRYAYLDEQGDPEQIGANGTRFRWVRASDDGTGETLTSGATLGTAQPYTVRAEDREHRLSYCITPVATVAPAVGTEDCSLALTIGGAGLVWYVKPDAAVAGSGQSWTDAFPTLQDALAVARSGDRIWVATGVYRPDDSGDRTASFVIPSGVAVYGGFAGDETTPEARDWRDRRTVLSGDLDGDDTAAAGVTQGCDGIVGSNSDHVVRTEGADSATVLDGFTVTAGQSDADGGGWLNVNGAPTLTNLLFAGNRAGGAGGGMHSLGSPALANVAFVGNCATQPGSGFASAGGAPVLTNVSFSDNAAMAGGGAAFDGGATLVNALLWGDANGELAPGRASLTVAHSLIQACGGSANWNSACGLDGGGNLDADPLLLDPAHGDLRPASADSPLLDAGDMSVATGLDTDLAGNPRVQGTTIDIGAYERAPPLVPPAGAKTVTGTAGDDRIEVTRGIVSVNGGAGDDILGNAAGRQTLDGGPGADVFVYRDLSERGDIVTGFEPDRDRIDVSALLAKLGYTGTDPFGAGYLSLRASGSADSAVYLDPDGAGKAAAVQLVLLRGVVPSQLHAANFIPAP